jgi:putative transcriptional regulator
MTDLILPPPDHHPSSEILLAYGAGTLPAGFDLVAGAHVRSCARCQRDVTRFETAGGLALGESEAVTLRDDALAETMERLTTQDASGETKRSLDDLIARARPRTVAPGVWVAKIDTPHAQDDRVYLLGAKPGVATAKHSHEGLEFTQILRGALADDKTIFRVGDFVACDASVTHHPHATGAEECVCLIATRGRLTPSSWIGRLAFIVADV